jgi:hypothetical protein
MGKMRNAQAYIIIVGKRERRINFGPVIVDGRMILKCILKKYE